MKRKTGSVTKGAFGLKWERKKRGSKTDFWNTLRRVDKRRSRAHPGADQGSMLRRMVGAMLMLDEMTFRPEGHQT